MKLKSVIIAACSCLCIQAMADGTFFRQFKDNGRIAARLHAVTTQRGMVLSRAGLMAERALPAAAPAGRLRLAPAERNAEEGTLKLDSIIQVNVDGTKLQKQQYVYNDQGKEINRKTSYWNASTQTWDEPYEEYDYEWTDYGYILSQRGVYNGQGVRMDYKYNDKRQGIEQINYELDADGNWVPTSKGEYEYDDNDNIISEYVYAWTGSEWLVATHNTATWDAKKRQTSFESYTWDGSAWVGADKGEYVWFDGPYDPGYVEGSGLDPERMSYKYDYFWIDGAWHNYYIFVNDISETDGRLLGQAEKVLQPQGRKVQRRRRTGTAVSALIMRLRGKAEKRMMSTVPNCSARPTDVWPTVHAGCCSALRSMCGNMMIRGHVRATPMSLTACMTASGTRRVK